MSNKVLHYNIDKIVDKNAGINLIYGERSNGKSYQVKHKRAVIKYLKTGKRFILMRRLREEIDSYAVSQYFKDVDFMTLTNNKYNTCVLKTKKIYLANIDIETNKTTLGEQMGYAVSLSTEQNYAGGSYLDVEDIIFEEFMSRTSYLANEPFKLKNFYCTVDRKRGVVKLWLIGNTISRICPYIEDWGLHNIIAKQKQGTIEVTELKSTDDDVVRLAIEYCEDTKTSSHTIGLSKDMLNNGSWQSNPQPHLPKSRLDYNCLYKIIFFFKGFTFIGEYLQDKESSGNICWFIKPYSGIIKDNIIVISDVVKINRLWQRDIYNINIKNDKLQTLLNTFKENQIFYSDDLTGTDFKQAIDFAIRR